MFNKYPYTNFHDLNLDWIITEVKKVADEYDALVTDVNAVTTRVSTLESNFAGLTEDVQDQFDTLEASIKADVAQMKTDLDASILAMEQELTEAIEDMNADFNQLSASIATQLNDLRSEFSTFKNDILEQLSAILTLAYTYSDNNLSKGKLYTDTEIRALKALIDADIEAVNQRIDELVLTVTVWDGYEQENIPIAEAVDRLNKRIQIAGGLEANTYYANAFNPAEYSAYHLKAERYDFGAFQRIFPRLRYNHEGALTVSEYDALGLTSSEYAAKNWRIGFYDYFSKIATMIETPT